MSDLSQALDDFLKIRRALGFQLRGYDRFLGDLVSDLELAQSRTMTTELAVAWATKPTGVHPFRHNPRLSIARGFARYMQTIDPATQVPPSDLLAYRPRAWPAPYLYSAAEIDALLQATDTLLKTSSPAATGSPDPSKTVEQHVIQSTTVVRHPAGSRGASRSREAQGRAVAAVAGWHSWRR